MKITLLFAPALLGSACGLFEIPRAIEGGDAGGSQSHADASPPGLGVAPDANAARDAGPERAAGTAPRPPDGASVAADARNDAAIAEPPGVPGGVTIGGRAIPRDKVIVFLAIGHSNMAGRTNLPPEMRPFNFETHPRLWAYAMGGAFQPAKEPLSGDFLTRMNAGPGMSILRAALALAKAPDSVMVSIMHGHDGSRGGFCKSYRRGGILYDIVMGPAKQLKDKVTFGGIFSMLLLTQVFGDKPNLLNTAECMQGIASEMRADLGDPDIPFLMGDWEMNATEKFAPTFPDAMVAREQLRMAQRVIPRSAIIPTDMLPMSDNHHFDLTGYKIWGERAVGLIKQGGWAPWASP
jgi:hypothetical protein